MSSYSKEFDEGLGEFSIKEEFAKLKADEYVNEMCEGFGFSYLGKNEKGEEIVGFIDFSDISEDQPIKWIPFSELTAHTYKEIF